MCKGKTAKFKSLLPEIFYYNLLFHTVSINVIGPFTKSASSYKFPIIAINKLIKWIKAIPIISASARTTSKLILHNIIFRHRCS